MRVRMFQSKFARLVENGTKRQTIRPMPKRLPKAGSHESWREWTGKAYRSPQRELSKVELTKISRFSLDQTPHEVIPSINHVPIPLDDWNTFAVKDGFASMAEMVEWFEQTHGLPFIGILIEAKDP